MKTSIRIGIDAASNGNQTVSRSATRNRRRAKDLKDAKLRELQADFRQKRNSLEVGQDHLLPRAEAVDGLLIRVDDELHTVRQELYNLRREMGLASASDSRLVLVQRRSA